MDETAFQQIARLVPEPMLLLRGDGLVVASNRSALQLAGTPHLVGADLRSLITDPPQEVQRYLSLCARSLQALPGSLTWRRDGQTPVEVRCDGGVLRPRTPEAPPLILLHCRPKAHAVEQFTLLNQKIAELTKEVMVRRRAEQERDDLLASERTARLEAERTSRMKDEFLATLSHELRTPMNAVLGWAQLLRSDRLDPQKVSQGLDTIERNARVQANLIEDLLDMSRIISGRVRLEVQQVELVPVIEAAIESVRPAAEAKSVRLQMVLDPLAAPIRGDPGRLQQVIWNLLSNAVKFTPKEGRVQVLLERVNSHVEITVSDTGEGIKPEFLPHLFERFTQADPSSTRRHGGLGLGLAIVKHLVELHGGSVRAKSPGEGQGTTFIVTLPLPVVHPDDPRRQRVHPVAETGPAEPDPCGHERINGVRVLVVDDEPDAQTLVKTVLDGCQARVATAGSAAEALRLMESQRFDVLLSDIGMPETDGYELLRRVRALPPERGGKIAAAAMTAFARAEDRRRALLSGFQMHVPKPVEPSELVAVVASLAGRT